MAVYELPDLPYAPESLEPHVSGRIIELHHGRHHRKYVEGANEALERLDELRRGGELGTRAAEIAAVEKRLAFNVSGHVLHSLFWQNMTPDGGGMPEGNLAAAIERDFGDFAAFREQMNGAAASIMGSGWALLAFEPIAQRLQVLQIHDHQSETVQGAVPLLAIDAWEHAYYLQYRNEKAKFFEALWNVWNWQDVARRLASATRANAVLESRRAPQPAPRAH